MENSCKPDDAVQFWEERYRSAERVWSGRVNPRLAEVTADLPVGRALDLGCGEGADALWLAERGWQVVAVDVSATALRRATEAASAPSPQPRSSARPTGRSAVTSARRG
ncbi:bifunctional 2-polyprenyl-6-hydroxyphenol methylase/3-demethylubiquinol 3-O-methyltransferase UbiG, partial [Mycobacterium sp. 1245852.3]|uniref:class I SAM-dependent methyltransferase n=1 Tax=Mycobacterium sp. 1245852.3 TaxID=1856860 RepID=UPI001E34F917